MKEPQNPHAIITYSGIEFDLMRPRPEMVSVEDIAHALSLQCRYNGHIPNFYSVAEHSILVSDRVRETTQDRKLALAALLHDAAEAYTGDMVRPLKHHPLMRSTFVPVEQEIERVIGERFGIDIYPMHEAVKEADSYVYAWEVENIRTGKVVGAQPYFVASKFKILVDLYFRGSSHNWR